VTSQPFSPRHYRKRGHQEKEKSGSSRAWMSDITLTPDSSFAGPEQMLRYLSRYTHRVAISNRRLVSGDDAAVPFRWKDYRAEGPDRWKTMTRMSRCASK
jgi:Putative transposase